MNIDYRALWAELSEKRMIRVSLSVEIRAFKRGLSKAKDEDLYKDPSWKMEYQFSDMQFKLPGNTYSTVIATIRLNRFSSMKAQP